jgi:hypothetical protein
MMIIAIKSALIESLKEAAWLCFLFCIVFSSVVIQKLTKKKAPHAKRPEGQNLSKFSPGGSAIMRTNARSTVSV